MQRRITPRKLMFCAVKACVVSAAIVLAVLMFSLEPDERARSFGRLFRALF